MTDHTIFNMEIEIFACTKGRMQAIFNRLSIAQLSGQNKPCLK